MASKFNQKVQEMERIEFLRLIDNIYKGEEHIPWYELNKNSQYAKFIGSLIKDRSIILNFFFEEGSRNKRWYFRKRFTNNN